MGKSNTITLPHSRCWQSHTSKSEREREGKRSSKKKATHTQADIVAHEIEIQLCRGSERERKRGREKGSESTLSSTSSAKKLHDGAKRKDKFRACRLLTLMECLQFFYLIFEIIIVFD